MPHADIKLGYSCNNNCLHCVIADQRDFALKKIGKEDRSTEEYKKELYDSRINGCDSVTFTGGEPTIRKDLFELINVAKKFGFVVGMQTNGRAFYYKKIVDKFKFLDINYTIALHGPNEKVHDDITRSKGSFNQTVGGIKNLIEIGAKVHGKVVLSKLNYFTLPRIASLFVELGVKKMNFAFPHAQGNAWRYFDEIVPSYSQIRPYVHKTIQFIKKYNEKNRADVWVDFEAIPFCFMRGYEEHVAELKNINKHYSELKQVGSEKRNWEQIRKEIKSKFPQCKKCKWDELCEGVWNEYLEKKGDKEFEPIIN